MSKKVECLVDAGLACSPTKRVTLVKVLYHDRANICNQWHELLKKELPETDLTQVKIENNILTMEFPDLAHASIPTN